MAGELGRNEKIRRRRTVIRTYYVIKEIISIKEKSKKRFENAIIKPTSWCVNKN